MKKGFVLYNKKAGKNEDVEAVKNLAAVIDGELELVEVSKITNYQVFLSGLNNDDYIILCGGDGTINRFVNDTEGIDFTGEILYFPVGTGNDFALDLGHGKGCKPFSLKEYM